MFASFTAAAKTAVAQASASLAEAATITADIIDGNLAPPKPADFQPRPGSVLATLVDSAVVEAASGASGGAN